MDKRTYSKVVYFNEPSNLKPETELEKFVVERFRQAIQKQQDAFMDKYGVTGDGSENKNPNKL